MKTLFIEQLTPDSPKFADFFVVRQCDRSATKGGKPYLTLKLGDKTGDAAGKLWDIPEGLTVSTGDIVKVACECSSYRDVLQLKITKIRVAEPGEWSKDDFVPVSKHDRGKLLDIATQRASAIERDDLRHAVYTLLGNQRLVDCPAAKRNHQAYLGGLLEHIINLTALVNGVCETYPDLDRDILLAAAIVHDIGKVEELGWDTAITYTRAGSLVGHIIQGSIMWEQVCGDVDPATRDHIRHIIASHHGRKEWGAAQVPMTREAAVFHLLDLMDAQMEIFGNALEAGVDDNGFTPFIPTLSTSLWNGK